MTVISATFSPMTREDWESTRGVFMRKSSLISVLSVVQVTKLNTDWQCICWENIILFTNTNDHLCNHYNSFRVISRESKTETENRKTCFEFKTENRFWNQIGFKISNPRKWAILGIIHVKIGNFGPLILPLVFHINEIHS